MIAIRSRAEPPADFEVRASVGVQQTGANIPGARREIGENQ